MPHVTVKAKDGGTFQAYVAMPARTPAPGLVVIQEIFGVNKVMRDLTDSFAAQGYVAICPDIFWRIEPGVDITDQTEAEWQKAFDLFGKFDVDNGVQDLIATLDHVRGMPECTGKAGSVGYCLGGKLAYLMAARSDSDANVSYYGVGLDGMIDEAGAITKPYLSHVAENDGFVPPEAQAKFVPVLEQHPKATVHVYAGQDHAFARVGGKHYDKASADLANGRTRDFLAANLG
ncbi:carboxymethylenebutenolidase [Thalassobaculum fulvum]|uniref:Carboxymethylenebutenolidase n=1 Tax=Thalassobaculum fulvum TaxID=1633335 RepID=A0A919CMG4_9PROT|nr:dienelactone hydrolase family protein [Thalassobaculum fulvum]GHD39675.1 carboxymethylenebutenolidase [Thalassobaculum fulvum]